MRIFISYRREDTAGRAGRLFDALVTRFGGRNVFQDVTGIAPGVDFDDELTAAIGRSDVALVVIGPGWLTATSPDGSRRLDEPGDYVRREVAASLAAGVPVVPVLVGGATLPGADQLPDELAPLAQRQAFEIDDDSWHRDVGDLARRLEGEQVIPDRRRTVPLVVAGIAAVAVAATVVLLLLRRDGDDGSDTTTDTVGTTLAGDPTGCPTPDDDEAWETIDVRSDAAAQADMSGVPLTFTVDHADFGAYGTDDRIIVVEVSATNDGDDPTAVPYFDWPTIRSLLVDGVALGQGRPDCFSLVRGDPNLEPGERAVGLAGFITDQNPADSDLILELLTGSPDIRLTN